MAKGLSRDAIVSRALAIGAKEGLESVSLRRLAEDFDVTPMALYRHVRHKQDLINAMTEKVLDGFDISAGIKASMPWQERIRRAMGNYKEQMLSRPLAMPLSIAYAGEAGPASFWRIAEDLLAILIEAGFSRRQAVVLIRVLSNLLSGYLFLLSQGGPRPTGARETDLYRRRLELVSLSLAPEAFPNMVKSAREFADVWISDPDRWWRDTVDLLVFGLEGLLAKNRPG